MQVSYCSDYNALSQEASDMIIAQVKEKPNAVLCLAAGDTPKLTYAEVVKKAAAQQIDFSQVIFIGLDEWVGVPPENEGSCHYFLYHNLFNPLKIAAPQIHVFDALSTDLSAACKKMDKVIAEKGSIDLMLAGVGMNGHIGFNEPGVNFNLYSHVIDLDENTQSVGQKYFSQKISLPQGITLGLKHFMEAKKAIVIANGEKKAPIIKKVIEGSVTNDVPASIVQRHPNGFVIIDKQAADLTSNR
jgi:glucosamine-6-phosphate isomerase